MAAPGEHRVASSQLPASSPKITERSITHLATALSVPLCRLQAAHKALPTPSKLTFSASDRYHFSGEVDDEGRPHGRAVIRFSDGACFSGQLERSSSKKSAPDKLYNAVHMLPGAGGVWRRRFSRSGDIRSASRDTPPTASAGSVAGVDDEATNEAHVSHDDEYHPPCTIDGLGSVVFADRSKYEGHFSNGQFQGTGTYVFASGEVYHGDFDRGDMHGTGKLGTFGTLGTLVTLG
jgi:hypothetical protein